MAFMITKVYTTHVVVSGIVYVQILSRLLVEFAEIQPTKPKKNKIKIVHISARRSVRFRFRRICESAHRVKAFYFFGSFSVRFRCICEMAFTE